MNHVFNLINNGSCFGKLETKQNKTTKENECGYFACLCVWAPSACSPRGSHKTALHTLELQFQRAMS